jgi:hypothetical protein
MAPRLEFQTLLEGVLGTSYVYFQPPSNVTMQYDCIVYSLDKPKTEYAGNKPYSYTKRYQVTVISRNPDTPIPDKVAMLPTSIFSRYFAANNLHHYVFTIYF